MAAHICENIVGVLKVGDLELLEKTGLGNDSLVAEIKELEVGNKKVYDPRSYLKKAEQSLCDRLKEACDDLLSTGKSIFGKV